MAPQPLPQVEHLQGQNYLFSWEGVPGRVYFIQTSSSLTANEFDWEFAPDIRVGTGSQIEMGFQANAAHFEFFRLVYSDPSGGEDPDLADYDGDGFTNLEEAVANTNPYDAQSYPGSGGNTGGGNTGGGNSGGNSGNGTTWNHPWEYSLSYQSGSFQYEDKVNPYRSAGGYSYDLEMGDRTDLTFQDLTGENQVNFIQLELNLSYQETDPNSEEWNVVDVVTLSAENPTWFHEGPPRGSGATGVLIPIELIPDYNRDGKITKLDKYQIKPNNPWRFWRNSDDDWGTEGGDDIQESDSPDYRGTSVDGVRDLVDFFPVHCSLKSIFSYLPHEKYQFFLKHQSQTFALGNVPVPTFNVIWYPEAELEGGNTSFNGVGAVQKNRERAWETTRQTAHNIPGSPVGKGLRIPSEMLVAAENNRGVILVESRFTTDNPIVLEIKKNDGTSVAEVEFPIKVTEVEDMLRLQYIDDEEDEETIIPIPTEPSNWPDDERDGNHFVLVHGYNVNEEQARGWHGETFKRIFWSGSNAMFTGISWHGDEGQIPLIGATPDYWRNVYNAFQTSEDVADFVNRLPGSNKLIAAHSLGNVVVSSAIKDHGMSVQKYFMIDAAAPLEAYSPWLTEPDIMSHPDWRNYERFLWCSDWHYLFHKSDARSKLTWKDRFGNFPQALNFYSSGEEVLKNGTGAVPSIGAELAWVYGEMTKGFSIATGGGIFHNGTGGWDFNGHYDDWPLVPLVGTPISPGDAAAIPRFNLRINPFFEPFSNEKMHDPDDYVASAEADKYDERSTILSESMPAISFAAGSNPIDLFMARNFDMMNMKNGWPRDEPDWLHSDIRNIAYLYTFKVYDKFTSVGGIRKWQ